MFKVVTIESSAATRVVNLLNMDTKTYDSCFDDSALVSSKNFDFMKEGAIYDCKIKLFGESVEDSTPKSVKCQIINDNIEIGKRNLVQVLVGRDVYYVYKNKINFSDIKDYFFFEYTRKDLIQVNETIHNDLLE